MYRPPLNTTIVRSRRDRELKPFQHERDAKTPVEWVDASAGQRASLKSGRSVRRLLPTTSHQAHSSRPTKTAGQSGTRTLMEVVRSAIRRTEVPLASLLQQGDDDRDGLLSLPEFARVVEHLVRTR